MRLKLYDNKGMSTPQLHLAEPRAKQSQSIECVVRATFNSFNEVLTIISLIFMDALDIFAYY